METHRSSVTVCCLSSVCFVRFFGLKVLGAGDRQQSTGPFLVSAELVQCLRARSLWRRLVCESINLQTTSSLFCSPRIWLASFSCYFEYVWHLALPFRVQQYLVAFFNQVCLISKLPVASLCGIRAWRNAWGGTA